MALYRLMNDDGTEACDGDARDDVHALIVLGGKLGKVLTFDGVGGPPYLMQRVETNQVQGRSREGRAVYVRAN